MSLGEIIISALKKGNIDLALRTAAKIDPNEIFSLLKNFSEEKYTLHIAAFLDNLGTSYQDTQRFAEAEKAYNEALKKYQSLASRDPSTFIPEVAAILHNLGTLYSHVGNFPQAEKAFNKALKIRKDLEKEDSDTYAPHLALTLNNVGALFLETGKFAEAENFFNKALQMRRDLAKKDPDTFTPDVAMTLNNLGTVYCHTGKFQNAEKAYAESLKIRRTLAEKNPEYILYVAMTLNNMGLLYKDTQAFSAAEKRYTEALKIRRNLVKETPEYILYVAMTLNNVGLLYRDTKRFFEAEKAFTEALEIYKTLAKSLKSYTFHVAVTLTNLGTFYRIIGKFFEAEKAFTEALEICTELAHENPVYMPQVAMTLNSMGLLYWDMKKFDKTEKTLNKALTIYEALARKNTDAYIPQVAMTLNSLGAVYLDKKEFCEAEKIYKKALTIYEALLKKSQHVYTFHVAGILNNVGLLYREKGDILKAEKYLSDALEKYKGMASWFYAANTAHNLSEINVDREYLEISRRLLEMAILFSKEEKYKYAQKGEKERIYVSLLEQDMSTFGVLEALRDPEALSLFWDQIIPCKELEKAQEDVEFQKKVVEDVLKKPIPPLKISKKLSEDVAFIYVLKNKNNLFFFVVNSDGIEKFKGEKKFFTTGVKLLYLLRFQLRAAGKPRLTRYVEKFEELTGEWYRILPKELRELIQEKDQIVFSPDYYCSFFPLEALQMNGQPLCVEKTVTRAASLQQFSRLSKNLSFDSSLIVGNPWPECSEKELRYSLLQDSKRFRIPFLNGAEEEAKVLAEMLPGSKVLLEQDATGGEFLSEISKHSLIHFCGHGSMGRILFLSGPFQGFPPVFEPEEFSNLRKAERNDKTKKINMMEEWHPVTDLDLVDVKLTDGAVVFLNACETGQHKYAGGGYFQGLPAVFLKNGAHSVVSSLIPIFDEHSKEVALHFYEDLLHTHSVAAALKKARIWAKETYKAQIYWVPYIHYGPPLQGPQVRQ